MANESQRLWDLMTNRLTVTRSGYLDELDFDLDARLGAPAGASISADLVIIDNFVDDIETRLGTPGAGTVAGDVESIEVKVGTNGDAAGTTTLFARLKQIVDSYLADGSIGLAIIEGYVDCLPAALGDLVEANVADILSDSTAFDGADIAAILTDTETTIPGTITSLQTDVTAILLDTETTIPDTITTLQADMTAIKGGGYVAENLVTIDANIDSILEDTDTTIPGVIATMQGNVTDILLDTETTIPGTITSLQTDVTAILDDTGTTGVIVNALSVAGETAIEGAAEDALEAENLDHHLKTAVDTNLQTTVADNSVIGYLLAIANVSNYNRATDSLEAIGAAVAGMSASGLLYGTALTGNVLPSDGTENTIVLTNGAGDFASDFEIFMNIDVSVLQAGDTIVMRVWKTVDGTNPRLADEQTITGVQVIDVWEMDSVWGDEVMDIKITLAQTAGGYRTFHWRGSTRKVAS